VQSRPSAGKTPPNVASRATEDVEIDDDTSFPLVHFDEECVHDLREFLRDQIRAESQLVTIEICSSGGECYACFGMIDMIEAAKRHMIIRTVCLGKSLSSGAAILASGSKGYRYAGRYSTFMIHPAWDEIETKDPKAAATHVRELNRVDYQMQKLLGLYSGKGVAWIMKQRRLLESQDWYMDAHTAQKFGFVDHIGIPW
jgi:ATP-dependent protease ClpP protease subunit